MIHVHSFFLANSMPTGYTNPQSSPYTHIALINNLSDSEMPEIITWYASLDKHEAWEGVRDQLMNFVQHILIQQHMYTSIWKFCHTSKQLWFWNMDSKTPQKWSSSMIEWHVNTIIETVWGRIVTKTSVSVNKTMWCFIYVDMDQAFMESKALRTYEKETWITRYNI